MSENNIEFEKVAGPQLEFIDIINATKIMEAAVARGIFNIKELAEVAPIVSRFQDFSAAILAEEESRKTENNTNDEQGE